MYYNASLFLYVCILYEDLSQKCHKVILVSFFWIYTRLCYKMGSWQFIDMDLFRSRVGTKCMNL